MTPKTFMLFVGIHCLRAIQCGFCTPGFITAGKALLDSNPSPTREEVREWYSKHWMACRCTGYVQVVDAVMKAAAILRGEEKIEDLAKMYKPGDSLCNSKYPRPSAVYKATGLWDFGDDDRLKLTEELLFEYPFALEGVSHAKVKKIDT